jgi:hypothetical protein
MCDRMQMYNISSLQFTAHVAAEWYAGKALQPL